MMPKSRSPKGPGIRRWKTGGGSRVLLAFIEEKWKGSVRCDHRYFKTVRGCSWATAMASKHHCWSSRLSYHNSVSRKGSIVRGSRRKAWLLPNGLAHAEAKNTSLCVVFYHLYFSLSLRGACFVRELVNRLKLAKWGESEYVGLCHDGRRGNPKSVGSTAKCE